MSYKFYPVKVLEVTRETPECVSVLLDITDEIKDRFRFQPGQYINIRHSLDGEEIRRSYSICSHPDERNIRFAVKKVESGLFSTYANKKLKTGDILEISEPGGNFTLGNIPEGQPEYVFFSAGSGITPVMSQIRFLLENENKSSVILFYGNKNFENVIFREELEGLKNKFMERFSLYYIFSKEKLGSSLFYGRINEEKCKSFNKVFFRVNEVEKFMLCGPANMIFSVRDSLHELGVEPGRIHFELFSTDGLIKSNKNSDQDTFQYNPEESASVKIKLDDDIFQFNLKYGAESILEAALKNGADLPFACKGGVCSTCKAKLVNGNIDMELNYALEPDELAAGYILTCQSHPRSSEIFIDFDQK